MPSICQFQRAQKCAARVSVHAPSSTDSTHLQVKAVIIMTICLHVTTLPLSCMSPRRLHWRGGGDWPRLTYINIPPPKKKKNHSQSPPPQSLWSHMRARAHTHTHTNRGFAWKCGLGIQNCSIGGSRELRRVSIKTLSSSESVSKSFRA